MEEQKLISKIDGSNVIVSHNLAAADALIFSPNDVLGYVTELGGATSHMALLARALKIPAVVWCTPDRCHGAAGRYYHCRRF